MIRIEKKPRILSMEVSTRSPLTEIGRISRFAHGIEEPFYVEEGMKILAGDIFSVAEHIQIQIEVEISERCARQFNRHRHLSIVQKSTRYNDYFYQKDLAFYLPAEAEEEDWKSLLEKQIQNIRNSKNAEICKESLNYMLPLCSMTKVHYSLNLRTLIHMFQVRSCPQALMEMRVLMSLIRNQLENQSLEWYYIMIVYGNPQCMIPGAFRCKNPSLPCVSRKHLQQLSQPQELLEHLQSQSCLYQGKDLEQWSHLVQLHQKLFVPEGVTEWKKK